MVNDFLDHNVVLAQLGKRAGNGSTQALAADLITVIAKHIAQRCQYEKGLAEYRLLEASADVYQLQCKLATQAEQIAALERKLL